MTEATITIEVLAEGLTVAHISGQLDESNVDEKIQEIYKVVEANPKGLNLIFDLENLEYMNSKSIGYLTDLYGKITESGGKVAIVKAKPNVVDILQVVGLTQLIKTYNSTEEAKAEMQTGGQPVVEAPAAPAPVETPAPTEQATVEPTPVVAPAPTEQVAVEPTPVATSVSTDAPTETPAEPVSTDAPTETPAAPAPNSDGTYKVE